MTSLAAGFAARIVLDRARPYDTARPTRLMQRTTVSGDPAEFAASAPDGNDVLQAR